MLQGTQQHSNTIRIEAFFFPGFGGYAFSEEWQLPEAQLRRSVKQTSACPNSPKQEISKFA